MPDDPKPAIRAGRIDDPGQAEGRADHPQPAADPGGVRKHLAASREGRAARWPDQRLCRAARSWPVRILRRFQPGCPRLHSREIGNHVLATAIIVFREEILYEILYASFHIFLREILTIKRHFSK